VSASKQILATIALVLVTTAVGVADHDYVRLLVAEALGLLAAWVVRVHAVHRLGGVTGDVFGALIEVATTVSLVAIAIEATWR
jgi:adenosylcobinamide-GDP ribazoletransferase